jgi:hypothetical protein
VGPVAGKTNKSVSTEKVNRCAKFSFKIDILIPQTTFCDQFTITGG